MDIWQTTRSKAKTLHCGLKVLIDDSRQDKPSLMAWMPKAYKPFANYYYTSKDDRLQALKKWVKRHKQNQKLKAERRANNKRQPTQSALAAKSIREILKREYPNIKFRVVSDNYANGSNVRISWLDNVPEKEIEDFASQYQYGHFDGMIDMYEYSNKKDFAQAKYVFCNREISQKNNDIIYKALSEFMNIENSMQSRIPALYMVNVRGYNDTAPLSALVYQIARNFDFTNFTGVRHKKAKDGIGEISNMFELY